MDAELVEWKKPRHSLRGLKGVCPDCDGVCIKFIGNTPWEGGRTPHKIRDRRYRARKKQRELYDVVENLPPIKVCYISE